MRLSDGAKVFWLVGLLTAVHPSLAETGIIMGAGHYAQGQLGNGENTWSPAPIAISDVSSASAGGYHMLAARNDHTLWVWGGNATGQLGNGVYYPIYTPVHLSSIDSVTQAAGGKFHSLVLKDDGTVWAWGFNTDGQVGAIGAKLEQTTPIQVDFLANVTAIAAGGYHSVALRSDGTVWAWGDNYYGQVGDGSTYNRPTPTQVSGLSGVIAVAAGSYYTLAVKSDGTVWAWGQNSDGQLGDGTTTHRTTDRKSVV